MERGKRLFLFIALILFGLTAGAQKYNLVSDGTWKATGSFNSNWNQIYYDDSGWGTSTSPTSSIPGFPPTPIVGIESMWFESPYSDTAYFRKEFELKSTCYKSGYKNQPFVTMRGDDTWEIYVNGVLFESGGAGIKNKVLTPFLRIGKNVIAIKAVNNSCSAPQCPYAFYFAAEVDYISGPEIEMDPDKNICEGDSVFFGPKDHYQSYSWSNGETTRSIKVGKEGKYWLTAKDTALCDWIDTVELFTYKHVDVSIGADQVICTGEVAKFDAGAGYDSYLWSTGDTTDTLTVNYQGLFWVDVVDNNGCTSTDTAEVQSFENAEISLGNDTSLCNGDTTVLVAFFPYSTYRWDDGSIDSFRVVTEPGNYAVTITNQCGAVNDDINIEYITDIDVTLGEDDFFCFNQKYELTAEVYGATSYLWSTGDTVYQIAVTEPDNYWVLVEDKCGNEGYAEKEIIHRLHNDAMIPNSFSPNEDAINETWKPIIRTYGDYEVQVIDQWGKLVFESNDPEMEWDGKVNGGPAHSGNYIYKITFVDCEFQQEIFTGVLTIIR